MKILIKFKLLLLFGLSIEIATAAQSLQDVINATPVQPTCYNGLCRTAAAFRYTAYEVAGFGEHEVAYFPTALEAMTNYASAYYGSFDGFCRSLGGSFVGIVVSQSGILTNNIPHSSYNGNCGSSAYSSPDLRGVTFPTGICPAGYFYDKYNSEITSAHGGREGQDRDCEAKFKSSSAPTPYKKLGHACLATPQPIQISTGNKYLSELDYQSLGLYSTTFNRSYNSQLFDDASTGVGWQLNWLGYAITNVSSTQVLVRHPDGKGDLFHIVGNTWVSDDDVNDKLEQINGASGNLIGWNYKTENDEVETYSNKGVLTSLVKRSGWKYIVSTTDVNSETSATTRVSDPLGRSFLVSVDKLGNPNITLADGGLLKYVKNANNLISVTYPDGKVKTYLYENSNFPNALTGIIDENGSRFVTYRYDSTGRAYDEELAPDLGLPANQKIEHNNLSYNVDGAGNPISTTVTDPLGTTRTYNFTTILAVVKSTGQTQPGGSGCSAAVSNMTYDANGNIATRTDFNGNMTRYTYDMARNLELSRTEGLATSGASTAASRTITTAWHATWRLPLVVTEYNGASATGTALKQTTTAYDTKGNITSITETDPVRNINRTSTINYTYSSAVPGLVLSKTVDGPRTDVNDITTYTYYPHDAACEPSTASPIINPSTGIAPANLGCRGQLMSMSNPLGQTTTYDRYNHHGQIEQMTDANGLETTSTYDERQRLLSTTYSGNNIASQTTSLIYDGVGQVIQLTMPDNSSLIYGYDAAHRLTQVQDTLGNTTLYTLDSAGNRLQEKTYDPQGSLAKTISRSYDALNRLQTLNGQE